MKRSSYRGEHRGSALKARGKIAAGRTFRLALALVLAVGLMPGLSYANPEVSQPQPSEGNETPATLSEQVAESVEERSDVSEGNRQQEDTQPEQQVVQQEEGQEPEQQPEQQDDQNSNEQDGQQPEQQQESRQDDKQEDQQQGQQPAGENQALAEPALTAMNAGADTAPTISAQDATVEITYSPSSTGTESVTIDGETRTVKTFTSAPEMTVTVSGYDFDTNKSRIRITNVLTGDVLTERYGANDWKQLDDSVTGRWQASYTIRADGRYKVEVSPNGWLAQTDYIDVDLLGPQVDVTFNKVGANPDGDTNYFKEWTSVTVTIRDRHFDTNTVTPRVSSPSGKPDTFFGSWVSQGTDANGNLVYTSTSSNFEESAFRQTYKFGVTAKDTAGHQTAYSYGDNVEADTATGAGAKTTKDTAGTALNGTNGFVVDTTRPTVAVKISSELAKHVKEDGDDDGTDYFGGVVQSTGYLEATIVVTDNNFNPDAEANKAISITKADGTETPIACWALGDKEKGYDGEKQWVCIIQFPQCKWGEKFSFSFTATDWAGLTTKYNYGDNDDADSDAGARSTIDGHGDDTKLNGANFVVDVAQPNVNVTMGGKRVYTDSTKAIDGFNANKVTVAVDEASFDAKATGKPKFMVVSGSTATETDAGIDFGEWEANEKTRSDEMAITLPDSKKNESYKFTLTAKSLLVGGETSYNYGDKKDEPEGHGGAISTKDSAGDDMTQHGSFIIDTKGPQLGVSFETNPVNTAGEKTGLTRYYDASAEKVVAKVSVTDVHLDTSKIGIKVYESDGITEADSSVYTVSSDVQQGEAADTQVATVTIDKPATDKTYILKVTGKDQFTNQIESADPATTYVEPAAGTADAYYQSKITFDTQAPKITVGWGDEATNGKYYNADREATITVAEANFDASRMQVSQDGGSTWETTAGSDWDDDGDAHTCTVPFTDDGTYTLQVKGTDLVGNPLQAGAVSVGGMSTQGADQAGSLQVASADPVDDGKPADTQQGSISDGTYTSAEFVIDKTPPTATVTWDNNDARDGMYYDAPRTATITVVERNFQAGDFKVQTAGTVSDWSSNGDVHTCTVSYTADGRYTLSVTGQDRAGSAMDALSEPEFVIDRTDPDADPEKPDADPDEPADDPVVPAADNKKAGVDTKGTTSARTARLGDDLFALGSPLVVVGMTALLAVIVSAAFLARRRKG